METLVTNGLTDKSKLKTMKSHISSKCMIAVVGALTAVTGSWKTCW